MANIGSRASEYESLKRAALDLARKGYAVLPLPAVKRIRRKVGNCVCDLANPDCEGPSTRCQYFGLERATQSEAHIESWWSANPRSRVGVALGNASHLAALLVQGRTGLKSLEELEVIHAKLPRTPTICSAGGEFVHLFSVVPGGVPDGRQHLAPGLHVLGEGEVVMVPPSVAVEGEMWEELDWDPGATLNQTTVSPLPNWILVNSRLAVRPPVRQGIGRSATPSPLPETERPRLRFRTGFEMAADMSTVWINRPWTAVKALTLLHGAGKGSGRTTFALHLVRSVLEGSRFLIERSVQGSVVLLTSESPASLGNAFGTRGYNQLFLDHLHVLTYQDAVNASWPEIVEAATEECRARDGRLLVIDRLNVFACREQHDGVAVIDSEAIIQPLLKAVHDGLCVFAVWDLHNPPSDGERRMPSTPLDAFVDIKLHLEVPAESSRERVILTQSRFDETPRKSLILLKKDGFEYVFDQPGLFQEPRGSALDAPENSSAPDRDAGQISLFSDEAKRRSRPSSDQ